SEKLFLFPEQKIEYLMRTGTGTGQISVPSQIGLPSVCRLMLKMGIEYLSLTPKYNVFSQQFEQARIAARIPPKGRRWMIATAHKKPNQAILSQGFDELGYYYEELVYRIELAIDEQLKVIALHFVYGLLRFIVPLNDAGLVNFQRSIDTHKMEYPDDDIFDIAELDISVR
ncbi:MAG: hypothetical protein AAFV98_24900, partial [Chloroflexota bacterium]